MKLPVVLKSILVGIPIGVTLFDSVGYIARVEGVSMQPALNPKDTDSEDYVLLNRWSVRTYDLTRGDIISLVSPKDPQQKIIKRVVGLEGDIISTLGYKRPYIRIPDGHCWVEGDHTGHSMDSNLFGPVSMGLITARASCIVWPPHRWQSLKPELPTVKRMEFDFVGNVFQNALALGDVDNDGHNELIVGNMNGDLSIFKYDRLWQKLDGLGMITAIAVGDILNCGSNALVVISGDGWCHILTKRNIIGNKKLQNAERMESFHVQRIPANTKVVLLADIDGDGQTELVLGLTDRIVRSYRWLPGGENSAPRLFTLSKWEGANQIGAVTLNRSADGVASVLVSQPGGSYMKISCDNTYSDLHSSISTEGEGLADSTVEYHPLSLSRMRSPNVSTEILGGIRPPIGSTSATPRYAVATLDGTIMLVDNQEVLWSMQVEQQVFGIRALDVTGDGSDEIVACAWSGQTYFLDQQRRSVRFQMDQPVAGFTAGSYAESAAAGNRPTLVYTTFSNKIFVYPDVRVPTMVSRGIQPTISGLSPAQQRELTEWCLYGRR